jgi:hypothetical protein
MSRPLRDGEKPFKPLKSNVPLWWKVWIAIEEPLYNIGIAIYALLLASFPFVIFWLIYLFNR